MRCLGVRYIPLREEHPVVMVSFSIPRKVGGAVVRNRIRRRLRSVLREMAGQMLPGAYLVTVRENLNTAKYCNLVEIMNTIIKKATTP
ncbi:MAG: ribonuclease P protein component [Actinobacteria bacterium]|jgi:ribonuclease P protein component|nr:ribonuclease P protein component [Actinomycetota bacterium]